MRPSFLCLVITVLLAFAASAQLTYPKKHIEDKPIDVPIPPGAVHIVVPEGKLDEVAKTIFTYYPYPQPPSYAHIVPVNFSGVYRIEINPEGKVTAVTILKTQGKRMDYLILKNFTTWRAKPGPLREVDVTWFFHPAQAGGVRSYY